MDYFNSAYTTEEFLGIAERIRKIGDRYNHEKNDIDLPALQDMADELAVRLAQMADAGTDFYHEFLIKQVNYRAELLKVQDTEEEHFNTTNNPVTGKKWTDAFNRARYSAEKALAEDLRQVMNAKALSRKSFNVCQYGQNILNTMARRIGILRKAWEQQLEYEKMSINSGSPIIQEGAQGVQKPFKNVTKDDGFAALMDAEVPTQSLAELEQEIEELKDMQTDAGQDDMDFSDADDDLGFLR